MTAKLPLGWYKIKHHPYITAGILVIISLLIIFTWAVYKFGWDWTGFYRYTQVTIAHTTSGPSAGAVVRTEVYQPEKALWDWMQLLIIPGVLLIIGLLFNHEQKRREEETTTDNQREASLKEYIDKMSELLLHENLRKSAEDAEVRKIARVLTLTVLSRLDANRKRSVMQFLLESDLINKSDFSSKTECIVHLHATNLVRSDGADLSGADLSRLPLGFSDLHLVTLRNANLSKAILSEADLSGADLSGANLREARLSWGKLVIDPTGTNLSGADLSGADLSKAIMNDVILIDADLSGANLKGVTGITDEELKQQAKSLKDATMPNGSKHP